MSHAIVTGADTKFFGHLDALIRSLEAKVQRDDIDICVYDFGLKAEDLQRLEGRAAKIVKPGWDFDFPCLKDAPEYVKAYTARPFSPRYFPGYETYLWIDADVWCQSPEAIDLFIKGAQKGRLAAVPEIDRSFRSPIAASRTKIYKRIPFLSGRRKTVASWMYKRFQTLYDREIANLTLFKPALNAGIHALPVEGPHWEMWATSFRKARFSTWRHLEDQVALNHAYYSSQLSPHARPFEVELLPNWCNWTCHSGLPLYDPGGKLFVEPFLPHHPISLVHMVNDTKSEFFDIETTEGYLIYGKLTLDGPRDS